MRSSRISTLLPPALIALGAASRLNAFLANRSLSLDEAAMARNIIDRPWEKLLHPLDYAQIAPPGFLLVEKAIVSIFGSHEYALRVFPLLCGILSVWLCWAVSRRILSRGPAILALALFAINGAFIEYSVQVKQYSADVCATVLVLFIATAWLGGSPDRRRSPWLGVAGLATAAFSFTAVFFLSGAAVICACVAWRTSQLRARPAVLLAPALWLAGAAAGTLIGHLSLTPDDAAYMKWFWAIGFMPLPPASARDVLWLWRQLLSAFSFTAQYRVTIVWVALVALGAWSLVRRGQATIMLLLLTPLLLVIAAAAARLYPFTSGRVQLFLLPALLILVAEGAGVWWRLSAGRSRWIAALPTAAILGLAIYSTWTAFRKPEQDDIRSAFAHVKRNWRPGDHLYVYYGAGQQFLYYESRYHFALADYVLGTCHGANGRAALRELDDLRGRARMWFVTSRNAVDPEYLLEYLDAVGTRLQTGISGPAKDGNRNATFVYLYDLSDSRRSESVSAETFTLRENLRRNEPYPWTCYGVFTPRGSGPSN
jgi:hypothetical protein